MKIILAAFLSLSVLSSVYGGSIYIRVETLHRVASENVACLDGCRIQGRHIVRLVGSPDKLGKFIAHSIVDNAMFLNARINRLNDLPFSWNGKTVRMLPPNSTLSGDLPASVIGRMQFLQANFFEIKDKLTESGRLDADRLQRELQKLQGLVDDVKNMPMVDRKFHVEALRISMKLDKLLTTWDHYADSLFNPRYGRGFILGFRENSGRAWKNLRIRRLFGAGFLAAIGEFFFSERVSAASLDDFDVEVGSEEYDLFYAAVEMERDRLLPYLENSDDPQDRDLALKIRGEIEAEGE